VGKGPSKTGSGAALKSTLRMPPRIDLPLNRLWAAIASSIVEKVIKPHLVFGLNRVAFTTPCLAKICINAGTLLNAPGQPANPIQRRLLLPSGKERTAE